jgi:uncharacterized protein (DUF305 family)
MDHQHQDRHMASRDRARKHYWLLGLNLAGSLAVMYLAMFAMIASQGEFIQNLNFFYMALVMWAPMGALMLATMPTMFRNKRWNLTLYAIFGLVFFLSLAGIRHQSLIGDDQFLRSMIPHHSGAILMCEQSAIRDPEIKRLCQGIIASQSSEIRQMKAMLAKR